jgi:hypothetical protein
MDYSPSRRSFLGAALTTVAAAAQSGSTPPEASDLRARISRADLIYQQPVERSEEGMPLGNGRMGTLVWTTPSQIRFQINRVDVYTNNSYTNSFFERHNDYCGGCAYVEIDFGGLGSQPFAGPSFHQRLAVYDGLLTLEGASLRTEMIAAPDLDVLAIEVHPGAAMPVAVHSRMLRHASQYFGGRLETFERDHMAAVETRSALALCRLLIKDDDILLTQEFTEDDFYNKSAVAIRLLGRTGRPEIANETDVQLTCSPGARPFTILIASAASFDRAQDPAEVARRQLDSAAARGFRALARETASWWHNFWTGSELQLESADGSAESVEQNYHYFFYLMGATSRGAFPPKFNGMLWNTGGDLRTWGAQHWFANLSCYYEALFAANRLELLDPVFDMYSGMREACSVAARQQWGSQGMYIPETAYFDGLEKLPDDVAAEMRELYLMRKPWAERSERFRTYAETKHPHSSRWNWIASGKWEKGRWVISERGSGPFGNVSHILGSNAKIAYLYWRRYEFTRDREWLEKRAYPMLKGAAEFYRNFPNVEKGDDGKVHIKFVNSNESVWGARDTDEDLSAMRGVFAALIRASEILNVDAEMRPVWNEFLAALAPLPTSKDADALLPSGYQGPEVFVRGRKPAVKSAGLLPDQNSLPMWFFDLCHVESRDQEMLRLANATFDDYFPHGVDANTPVGVLSKLPIAAAALGRAQAFRHLAANQIRLLTRERSTAYKGGGVLANRMTLREGPQALDAERLGRGAEAIHTALLQSAPPTPGEEPILHLFPAWPKEWNARFTLLARGALVVTSSIKNGTVGEVELHSQEGSGCRLRNPWGTAEVEIFRYRAGRNGERGETLRGSLLTFETVKGERIELRAKVS